MINQQFSEKLIEQYEERLKDKDAQIAVLKSLLEKNKPILPIRLKIILCLS